MRASAPFGRIVVAQSMRLTAGYGHDPRNSADTQGRLYSHLVEHGTRATTLRLENSIKQWWNVWYWVKGDRA